MSKFSSDPSLAEGYRSISDKQNLCGLKFLKEFTVDPGSVVLDMGCGSGYLASVLADRVGTEGKVIAVDPDVGRIKVAEKDYQHVPNVFFSEGSTDSFPDMNEEVYDLYFSNHVINRVPNKLEAFRNAFRCLKNGGKLAIHLGVNLTAVKKHAIDVFQPELYNKLVSEMYFYESQSKLVEYCEKAGFKIVDSYESMVTWSYQSKDDFLRWFCFVTHGLFDLRNVTAEKMKLFNPPQDEEGRPVNEYPECTIIAIKDVQ